MGKKSTKTSSTTVNQPPSWAVPLIQGGANAVMNTYQQNQPQLQALSNDLSGHLPALWQKAFDTSSMQPSFGYANDVLGGKYLNSNPYTTALAHQAGQDAANQVNSTFSLAGRTGSNDHATQLAKGVDQAENAILFQNYQNERGQQANAAGLLPQLYGAQFAGVTPALAATQLAGQLPYYGSASLGTIGSLLGGYGTSTQSGKQPGGWGNDVLNAAVSALPFVLSERAAKKDIERIGEWDSQGDGLGRYRFRYKFDPSNTINEGVMADEVEELRPWALGARLANGWRTVNYAALGSVA